MNVGSALTDPVSGLPVSGADEDSVFALGTIVSVRKVVSHGAIPGSGKKDNVSNHDATRGAANEHAKGWVCVVLPI